MLTSRGSWSGLGGSIDTVLLLDRTCRAHAVRRSGLLFDSRFAASAIAPSRIATVMVVAEGSMHVSTSSHTDGPGIWIADESEFERRTRDAASFRTWGYPTVVFDLCLPAAELCVPIGLSKGPIALEASTRDAIHAVFASEKPDETRRSFVRVLEAIAAQGVVQPSVTTRLRPNEPAHVERLWSAMQRVYEQHNTGAYLELLAQLVKLSARQIQRDATELTEQFGLFGFRTALRVLRLRRAVLLLSARDATVSSVAKEVGYGSTDAMARAFRDAGLPPPSAVRTEVLCPKS